tara:strand:- start:5861 stop:6394 length:534 start_codon:yes stop_codon:yes gene_type:complete
MKSFLIVIGLSALLLVGGSWWSSNTQQKAYEQEIVGITSTIVTDRTHVQTEVDYKDTPPVGGNHAPTWLGCNGNIYDEPVRKENAVHSLEHGAVWVTYQPELAAEEIETLKGKVKGYSFISPYPEQESPIMLTAWGIQLPLDSADDPRVDQFLAKFRQGPQTPEPGATCNAIPGGMQ